MHNTNQKAAFIALIGAPNAGKSTLLNRMVGQKLAIVTPKAQTTRNRIMGIAMEGGAQLIFVDVPGIFDAGEKKFENAMVECAWNSARDADICCVMVDAQKGMSEEVEGILKALPTKVSTDRNNANILIINKIDLIKKDQLLALIAQLNEACAFAQTFMISAKTGDGVEALRAHLAQEAPQGPWLFPEDQVSDIPMRLLASEITREKCFLLLQQELPYALTVETEQWQQEEGSALITIHQTIYVQREGQKGIILGKGGAMIKKIGATARHELERMVEAKINLQLFVKVREQWKESSDALRYLGLQ